jgi:colanic acid/amylovoran biosynthesis glycosyltransferase
MEKTNKKRIIVVIPEFPRLTETFIERDVSKLAEFEDIDLTVFSLVEGKGYLSPNLVGKVVYQRLKLLNLISGVLLQCLAKPQITVDLLVKVLAKDSFDTTSIWQRVLFVVKGAGYAQLFKKFKPQEVHSHFLSDISTICMVSAQYLGVPLSLTVHAKDVLVNPSVPIVKVGQAKFISVCNKYAHNRLLEMAKDNSSKIHLIYHGLDEKRLEVSNLTLIKPKRPLIFLLVSRLVEKKGVDYMLQASRILLTKGIDHEVIIIGANDPGNPVNMYEKYKEQVLSLKMQDVVKFLGEGKGVPFEEAKQYYKIADIFVMPSISATTGDADGVPNTVIEAALSKLPIIATDAGSIKDLLNEQNSILVEQKNAEQLASAIERLIYDPELRESLGKRAYYDAKEMFSSAKNVSILHKLLLE